MTDNNRVANAAEECYSPHFTVKYRSHRLVLFRLDVDPIVLNFYSLEQRVHLSSKFLGHKTRNRPRKFFLVLFERRGKNGRFKSRCHFFYFVFFTSLCFPRSTLEFFFHNFCNQVVQFDQRFSCLIQFLFEPFFFLHQGFHHLPLLLFKVRQAFLFLYFIAKENLLFVAFGFCLFYLVSKQVLHLINGLRLFLSCFAVLLHVSQSHEQLVKRFRRKQEHQLVCFAACFLGRNSMVEYSSFNSVTSFSR